MKRFFLVGIVASLLMICFLSCSNSGRETVRTGIDTGFNGNKEEIPVRIDTIDEIAEDDSFENAARYDEDLALVSLISHRVAVMQNGSIVEELAGDKIMSAKHPYTRKLLDSVFTVQGNK